MNNEVWYLEETGKQIRLFWSEEKAVIALNEAITDTWKHFGEDTKHSSLEECIKDREYIYENYEDSIYIGLMKIKIE